MQRQGRLLCQVHQGQHILFICKSQSCNLPLLCQKCRKNHLSQRKYDVSSHIAQIISINKAMQQAQINLTKNKSMLKQLIDPFDKQKQIFEKIREQKQKLLDERNKIIAQITDLFDNEIAQLERQNTQVMLKNKEKVPFEEINQKIGNIKKIQSQFKRNPQKLREALNYNQQPYINQLRKTCQTFSSMNSMNSNDYFIYDDCKHDFFLSRLELKKKSLHNKLLKKVHNPSQLYFLIDDYDQDHYLHYFSSMEKQLRIFDIDRQKWKIYQAVNTPIPLFGATVYDYRSKRFYLVGGQLQSGAKSNKIIWYERQGGWGETKMSLARSSCMVTLIDTGNPNHHSLLIAGGIGDRRKHLKHCQIYHPDRQTFEDLPPLNFPVSSAAIVTFNKTTVFKIGGLGDFSGQKSSICEVAQKFDYGAYSQNKSMIGGEKNKISWVYIDLEVVNTDVEKHYKIFYANQAAIQINPNQIFVFGGWSHQNIGEKQTYIIQIETITNPKGNKSTRYYVRWINEKPLISGEGFADLKPIIYKKRIMSLQNISQGKNQVLEKQKKLIEFNMYEWFETENIVDI